jgi:hypothetical protein
MCGAITMAPSCLLTRFVNPATPCREQVTAMARELLPCVGTGCWCCVSGTSITMTTVKDQQRRTSTNADATTDWATPADQPGRPSSQLPPGRGVAARTGEQSRVRVGRCSVTSTLGISVVDAAGLLPPWVGGVGGIRHRPAWRVDVPEGADAGHGVVVPPLRCELPPGL